eukprot:TRINITY_DN2666_c0_g1_i1.p1 TRINITY_DN2666_c0_g1~~TRINITY_DN2666_c0_g1_i1.p1  ORF type:complete len:385 (+),score=113.61 TRINITY_DN2666_c0_g1_i1:136-1155(+)
MAEQPKGGAGDEKVAETLSRLEEAANIQPLAVAQKRCKRCFSFFTEATNGTCVYHSGEWVEQRSMRQGVQVGWQCCRVSEWLKLGDTPAHPVINEAALKKNCPGCCEAPYHIEDEVYTRCVSAFPLDPQAALQFAVSQVIAQEQTAPPVDPAQLELESRAREFNEQNEELLPYTLHPITSLDTLAGLSLRFNTPVNALQRLNKLPNQQIQHLKYLRIPKSEAEIAAINAKLAEKNALSNEIAALRSVQAQEQTKIKLFRKATGVQSNEETKFYLQECNGDLDEAIKLWKEDQAWEEANKHLIELMQAKSNGNSKPCSPEDEARRRRRARCSCFLGIIDP